MSSRSLFHAGTIAVLFSFSILGCSDDTQQTFSDAGSDMLYPDASQDIGPGQCRLTISKINGRSIDADFQLTAKDDNDTESEGLQIEVEVAGTNLDDGTTVKLNVTGSANDLEEKAANNKALFSTVTIPSRYSRVVLKAYDASSAEADKCVSSSIVVNITPPPECTIEDPKNGITLLDDDDKNSNDNVFTYDIKVKISNAPGGEVSLKINKTFQKKLTTTEANSSLVFADQILSKGAVEISAEVVVGDIKRSCTSNITVKTEMPTCKIKGYTKPPLDIDHPLGSMQGFGNAQDTDANTAGLQTGVIVETESFVNKVIVLVNDAKVKEMASSGTGVTVPNVSIADGQQTLSLNCIVASSGKAFGSTPSNIFVDTKAPEDFGTNNLTCQVIDHRSGQIRCDWKAVADPSGGSGMELYEVRLSESAITAANWNDAALIKAPDVKPAFTAGQPHSTVIKDIPLQKVYYVGVRGFDYVKNGNTPGVIDNLSVKFKSAERSLTGTKSLGAVMAAGDFNCDGYTDVAAGDPEADSGRGKVYVYRGTVDGVVQTPWTVLSGTVDNGKFGAGLAALSNFDKDSSNCADLAVYASHGGSSQAQVFLYLGKSGFSHRKDITAGDGAEAIYQLNNPSANEILGEEIAEVGDFDNDGATDLAISHRDTDANTAKVYIIYGESIPLMTAGKNPVIKQVPSVAGVTISGGSATDGFGLEVTGGALDGDSYGDVIISAKDTPGASGGAGAVYVIKGGQRASSLPEEIALTDATRVIKIVGDATTSAFGSSIAYLGDVDKDGTNDFAVGDPTADSNTGIVYLFNLATTPASVADAMTKVENKLTGAASDSFGIAIGSATCKSPIGADLNGDTYADFVISSLQKGTGAAGAVFEFLGAKAPLSGLNTTNASYTFDGPSGAPSFGATLILARDLNNDGYVDIVVGDPQFNSGQGRFFVYY